MVNWIKWLSSRVGRGKRRPFWGRRRSFFGIGARAEADLAYGADGADGSAPYPADTSPAPLGPIPLTAPPSEAGAMPSMESAFPRFKSSAGDQVDPRLANQLASVRMKLRTAYTPSQPISDRRRFAGRADVLGSLIRALEDQKLHIIIYGERGIGKTSILHVLAQTAREAKYIVTYYSCGAASNFDELFRAVAANIPLLYHSGYSPLAQEAEHGSSLADLLTAEPIIPGQASDMFAKLTRTRVLIVLDEFDRVESDEFRLHIAELIKNLSDRSVRVQLVIGGVASDLMQLFKYIPSIRRNVFALQMPKMPGAEIRHLIKNGEDSSGLNFDAGAMDFIVFVANGSPYIASLVSHHAGLVALDSERTAVTADDVAMAVDRALDELKGRISRHSLVQIDQITSEGTRKLLGFLAGVALFAGGEFNVEDIGARYPNPENDAKCKRLIEDLAGRGVLVGIRKDEFSSCFFFLEDAVPIYLWILVAKERFVSGRKRGTNDAFVEPMIDGPEPVASHTDEQP